MTIIGVGSDKVITANVHSLCRLRDQLDRRATSVISSGLVEASALSVPGPFTTGGSSGNGTTHHLKRACKTSGNAGRAWRGENESIGIAALCVIEENPARGRE